MEYQSELNELYTNEIPVEVSLVQKEIEKQTVSKVKYIEYPVDKLNKVIWNENNDIDFNETIEIITKRNEKNIATIDLTIDFTAFAQTDDIDLSECLTMFDKICLYTIASLYNAGNKIISAAQIYKVMNKSKTPPNSTELKEIYQSIYKMVRTRITIDNKKEVTVCRNYEYIKWDRPLLAAEIVTAEINGRITEMGIRVLDEPALLTFAKMRKQYTTFPCSIWSMPIRRTKNRMIIYYYMLQQIAHIKNNQLSNKMRYDTIFEQCGKLKPNQKVREKNAIQKFLEYFFSEGFITGFNIGNDSIEVFY